VHEDRAPGRARLSAAEVRSLVRAWRRDGDTRARERLVLAHLPIARFVARRKGLELPAHYDVDDLASCGAIALLEAVDRFDPDRGASFPQFAWSRVTGAVADELRRLDWASRSVRGEQRRLQEAGDRLTVERGRRPTQEELAADLGLEAEDVRQRLEDVRRAELVSLDAPFDHADGEGDGAELADTVAAPADAYGPEDAVLRHERARIIARAITALTDREREALALVHVHDLPGPVACSELGISETRVSQLLINARRKLRARLAAEDAAPMLVT
jgi:RNA polymerase sigma factor for flagellar operon FliA